ncbi:uncharacterized protein Z519_01687 [Cladophialophora bantiana CBS 173.52]|uniref:Phytanoyl-CoA dioxygenase n=1 Tax=Cladophialophora bantiana (strain ATCC 10958 / CBS 173.52 / CDC B-1940 / NIH 8579) TaxID=1442370 RepID=A0A0D2HXI2_CLAB1|nr:uncharacterized protein Z519_01687 [Cladophialophora bantiana CBS 173.52]KIW98103.1 hypothetical protein Z519_01687 [Cladophialophora bantiana CBS 173.52]
MARVDSGPDTKPLPPNVRAIQDSIPQSMLGWLCETSSETPIEEIRRRLFEDEYVFVKGLLPRDDVLKTREHYFSQFKSLGLLKPDIDPVDGKYNMAEDISLHNGVGGGGPTVNDELERLVKAMCSSPTWISRRTPSCVKCIGVHYDKLFLRGGDAFFLTAWVPLGDVTATGGGLVYLEDSTSLTKAIEDDFGQDHEHLAKKTKFNWFVADFEAGDVVFRLPYTIHTAAANNDPHGRIRLSTDLRFYDKKDVEASATHERWNKFWTPDDGI